MSRLYKRGTDPRPCQNGMRCKYDVFDYCENRQACAIDEDGEHCPYIRPYGRKLYEKENPKCEVGE